MRQGFYLLEDIKSHVPVHPITDYSYLVFPIAKAYEGFLKKLFLDLKFINHHEYADDHFRIGRMLSPHLVKLLKHQSVYTKMVEHFGDPDLADDLWRVWKQGRNLVFHYFPHNVRALSLEEAENLTQDIVKVMEKAVARSHLN